jgi:hypothetical protein
VRVPASLPALALLGGAAAGTWAGGGPLAPGLALLAAALLASALAFYTRRTRLLVAAVCLAFACARRCGVH